MPIRLSPVRLLQEVTRFIQEYSSQGDRTSPTGVNSNVQQPAEAAPSTSRALQSFRSIFAPYTQRLSPSACSSTQTSEKQPKRGKWSNFSFKRETWTHVAPGKGQKERLQDAGLGRICFHYEATSGEVKAKLKETFRKSREGGGVDIL